MRRSHVLLAVSGLGILVTWGGVRSQAPARQAHSSSARQPVTPGISCKPRPPVTVALSRHEDGTYLVTLTALEAAAGVRVEIGTGDRALPLWSGDVTAGEVRSFATALRPAQEDTWAAASIAAPAGTTIRSRAVDPGTRAQARAALASESGGGRIVVDPTTGDGVFEVRGRMEAPR